MPKKELTPLTLKKLKEHSKDHGGTKHMNAMKRIMEEPPYPSMKVAHNKVMRKQNKQDRLDEAEGKKKGKQKKTQTVKDRLDEAEGKKKAKKETMKIKKRKY